MIYELFVPMVGDGTNLIAWTRAIGNAAQDFMRNNDAIRAVKAPNAVMVKATLYYRHPVSGKHRAFHTVKPDLFMLAPAIRDGLKMIVFEKAAQAIKIELGKCYDPKPNHAPGMLLEVTVF